MAKQRPTLGTFAQPVSNFVQPIDPEKTVAPLDEQAIRQSYAFAEMFGQLSESAARMAAMIKKEQNEEEYLKGKDLVNQNRKDYGDLVRSGAIKPSENPWLAVGAQEASGVLQAHAARNEFKMEYEARVAEDPSLLDDTKFFDSLAASYAERKNAEFGDSPYLSRSFYNSFNPFMLELQAKNSDAVGERRISKIMEGVSSNVDMALQDAADVAALPPLTAPFPETGTLSQKKAWWDEKQKRSTHMDQVVIPNLQNAIDEAGRNSGFPELTNKAVVQTLIERMKTSDNPEIAERILSGLRGGTGPLKDTEFARQALAASEGQIRANFERMTHQDSKDMTELARSLADRIFEGRITPEQAENEFRKAAERRISANEVESKIPFMNGLVAQRRAAVAAEVKERAERDTAFTSAFVERSKQRTNYTLGSFTQSSVDTAASGAATDEELAVMVDQYRKMLLENSFVKDEKGSLVMVRQYDKDGNLIGEAPAENYSIIDISNKLDEFIATIQSTRKRSLDRKTQNAVDAVAQGIAAEIDQKGGVFAINFNSTAATWNARMNEAGVSLDAEKATAARKQMVIGVKQSFENAAKNAAKAINAPSLEPAQGDTPDMKAAKAKARGMIAMNKIAFAVAFDDKEYISEFRNMVRSLVTYDLEAGIPWQVEDMVYLYETARTNKIDMDTLFGTGEDSYSYRKFFETVSNFRMGAQRLPMSEAVKRAQASTQFSGVSAFGFVDLKADEGDVKAYTDSFASVLNEWRESNESQINWWSGWFDSRSPIPLNYESTQLAKKVFLDEYRFALQETAHADSALERAQEAVRTRLRKSGGSLILADDLRGIGPSQFKLLAEAASTKDGKSPLRKDASFVFVGFDQLGESVFALRGSDGLAIIDRVFKLSDIRKMNEDGEVVKRTKTLLQEQEAERMKSAPKFTTGMGPM